MSNTTALPKFVSAPPLGFEFVCLLGFFFVKGVQVQLV